MHQALRLAIALAIAAFVLAAAPALAQTFNSGSTGADGALAPASSTTLVVPSTGVFNFTTVNIPSGVTVRFARNATNTPITLLAGGNVTIAGTIEVSGANGASVTPGTNLVPNGGAGGPGGGDGGAASNALLVTGGGSGLGPGGGGGGTVAACCAGGGAGAGFSTVGANTTVMSSPSATAGVAYGAPTLLPLVGGSGGGGGAARFGFTGGGGGGGGGALLIAASGTITLTGSVLARGGNGGEGFTFCGAPGVNEMGAGGGGSGGAVRLLATSIAGTGGTINASGGIGGHSCNGSGGNGSAGRIRVEAATNTTTLSYSPSPSLEQPGVVSLPNTPTLRITSVAGVPAPLSPTGSFSAPDLVLPADTASPVSVALAASGVPPGTVVTVTVSGLVGGSTTATVPLAGTAAASSAVVSVTIPLNEPSVISASATFTLAGLGLGASHASGQLSERALMTVTAR
jgi:hypothetical protein